MTTIAPIQLPGNPANAVSPAAVCAANPGVSAYFYGYWFSYGLA